jgi:hypothetical protein
MKKVFLLFTIILFLDVSYSQEFDRNKKIIVTHNGDTSIGYMISYDTTYCLLELEDENHTILKILTSDIEKIEAYQKGQRVKDTITENDNDPEEVATNTEYPNDPNDYRLFLFPTGKSLGHLKVSVSLHEIILPIVSVGLFDKMTLSFGGYWTGQGSVLFVFPKINLLHSKNTDVAISGVYSGAPGELPSIGGFLLFTTRDDNVSYTFGGGIVGLPNRILDVGGTPSSSTIPSPPLLVLGLETRVSKHIKTVFEAWIIAYSRFPVFVPAGGARLFWEKFSMDFALGVITTSSIFFPIPIPLATLSYTF